MSRIFPFFYIHRKITKHIYTNYNIFIYILIALSVIEGVYYHKNQEIPWKTPWNKNIESTLYQLDTHDSENKKAARSGNSKAAQVKIFITEIITQEGSIVNEAYQANNRQL